jgi:phage repressor protein C with HTH and peptisase S24 domain
MNLTAKHIRQLNLESLIKESGLSKGMFAAKVGTAPAYISQMLSESKPRGMGDQLARTIEAACNKPLGWMDRVHPLAIAQNGSTPLTQSEEETGFADGFAVWENEQPLGRDEAALIFFQEVEIAAGAGRRTDVLEVPSKRLSFSKTTLRKQGVAEDAAYCVTVVGNSMEPVFPDGATLGIDTDRTDIKDGDIYAINHNGSLRVKLIYRIHCGGGLRLRSYNAEEWPEEFVGPEELATVHVLGRVFWCSFLR